jgi:hypothetical protein
MTPEIEHYQALIDGHNVTVERLNEDLHRCREEIKELRRIVATATLYITSLNEDNNLDEGDLLLDLNRQIKQYQTWRKDH